DPGDAGESVITLQPGGRLLLASDGVTEAFNVENEQFGEERLIEIAADTAIPHEEVITRLSAAVVRHRGLREQVDDITILCIDRVS
ncbi:MAG TPA: SpoIIE family protein phosphatase, partial [Tepidisphaeraceae bacterium]|nr:SpoIIE family protein phosphatase [Tepidisphaeraceae bacterium]